MPNTPSYMANGNISPSTAVKIDATAGKNHMVIAAGANDLAIGIAQEGTRRAPGVSADTYAAIAGESLRVYGDGEECLALLGSGGTTQGNNLKSDASGALVNVATTGTTVQNVLAQALTAGSEGEYVRVLVRPGKYLPAVA